MTVSPDRPTPRPRAVRPGRKLGPIAPSIGSAHRSWLEPLREAYKKSGMTLDDLSGRLCFAKSKLSELMRGIGRYPRWEIIFELAGVLRLPNWPLYQLWRQAAFEARKTPQWISGCSEAAIATQMAPPLEHQAFRDLVCDQYTLYAQAFLDDAERDAAVEATFHTLWLSWSEALSSPDTRHYAWNVLRATVMTRTPHLDGRPELGNAAFDTVALHRLNDGAERIDQLEESLQVFKAMSRLPAHQLDVMVLRRLYGLSEETTSARLGVPLASVQSDERHATHFLETLLCPPTEPEEDPA